jgi:hypothetical protein
MLRTRIDVERPAFGANRGERWTVEVNQNRKPWGEQYEVRATFNGEVLPERWGDGRWQPPCLRPIEGVLVPSAVPEAFKSLRGARERARRLADVLSGQLVPEWEEESY